MTTENQEKWLKVIRKMVRRHRLSSTPSERKGIAVDIAEQALWLLELVDQSQHESSEWQYEADKMRDCLKLANTSCEFRGEKIAELKERVRELEEDMECESCGDPNQVRRGG